MIAIFGVVALLLIGSVASTPLKICAFDVQLFGTWKARLGPAMEAIQLIIGRCDLCVIQQIRNADVTDSLMEQLNENGDTYGLELSSRTGRTASKEQIAFFYKKASLSVLEKYNFDDSKQDLFERDPFAVKFRIVASDGGLRKRPNARGPRSSLKEFFVIGVRTDPSNAAKEIDSMATVYDVVKEKFQCENGVIIGNLNAACNFFSKSEREQSTFFKDDRFKWLIDDDADTSVTETKCAYDRIVIAGAGMKQKAKNGGVFYFDKEYSLQPREAKRVSDHYPVEFALDWNDDIVRRRVA